jgi:hypothetical protein
MKTKLKTKTILTVFLLGLMLFSNAQENPVQNGSPKRAIQTKGLDQSKTLTVDAAIKSSGICNCVAPVPFYGKEYPSSGLTLATSNPWPTSVPISDLSSGKKIHFSFANGPCLNTVSDPCYGIFKATVNGNNVNSSSVGYGSQAHIEIPINYLIPGLNSISVKGICGSTTCNLATATLFIGNPIVSSGSISLTKNCCKRIIFGGGHLSEFSGQVSFTMSGSATSASLEITSPSGIIYLPFAAGNTTECYSKPVSIKLVDNVTHVPITGGTINGLNIYSYKPKFDISCMNIGTISISRDVFATLLPQGPKFTLDWANANEIERMATGEKNANEFRLISNFTNPENREMITLKSVVEINENGDMSLLRIEEAFSVLKNRKTPLQFIASKKQNYVGHVTLLR